MRFSALLLASCLSIAPAAHAETWKVLYWDTRVMLAIDAGAGQTTGENRKTVQRTRIEGTDGNVWASVTQEEVDCYDQIVRKRGERQHHRDAVTAERREVADWRRGGSEADRLLIEQVCGTLHYNPPVMQDVTVPEAMKAHAALSRNPDLLAVDPSLARWVPLFNEFKSPSGVQYELPSIFLFMQMEHDFVPLEVNDWGATFAANSIRRTGERWVQWHEMDVGTYRDPKHGGVWTLKEFDCKAFAGRDLAVGTLDRHGHILGGYEQRMYDVPLEAVDPESSRGQFLAHVCDPVKRVNYASIHSNVRGVLEGYHTFHKPTLTTVLGGGPRSAWREMYAYYCGPFGCRTHPSVELAKRVLISGLLAAATLLGGLYLRSRYRRQEAAA